MNRPVRRRVLLSASAFGLLAVLGLVVWLVAGGWQKVKSQQGEEVAENTGQTDTGPEEELTRRVAELRADAALVERRRDELFASLEAVPPEHPLFRSAYRDIIIISASELNRMAMFTANPGFAGAMGGKDSERGWFFSRLADLVRKYPRVCLPVVVELLGHPDPNVQGVATGCLELNIISSSSSAKFIESFLAVAPLIVAGVAGSDEAVARYVQFLAVVTGQKREVAASLTPMLRHPRPHVQVMAAEVFGSGYGQLAPKAVLELAVLFRDERHQAMYFAMSRSLKRIPRWWESTEGKQAVAVIAQPLSDPDKRRTAVDLLEPVGPEARAAIPYAVQVLQKADNEGRLEALRLLLATSPDAKATARAVPQLIELLRRQGDGFRTDNQVAREYQCRMEALKVLKALGPEAKAAAPAVKELAEVKNTNLRTAAVDTLKAIAP
jgi:cell division protein FtsB